MGFNCDLFRKFNFEGLQKFEIPEKIKVIADEFFKENEFNDLNAAIFLEALQEVFPYIKSPRANNYRWKNQDVFVVYLNNQWSRGAT